jgi:hypothetical protein
MAYSDAFRSGCARSSGHSVRRRLRLEELEARNLLSAQGLNALVTRPTLDVLPLAAGGSIGGLTPAQVRHAYGFDRITFNGTSGDGSGQTIAIVAGGDAPAIASDLATFDRSFGLPDPPGFGKVTPFGAPPADPAWALEISLDVEWAHAIAPRAKLLLVEAKSTGLGDMLSATDYARRQPGVVAVSLSWGSAEFGGESYLDSYFTTPAGHPGVTFVGASGDAGAAGGGSWPAISPYVLSVGGTSLSVDAAGNYVAEAAWSGGGGGFSAYEGRPAYQVAVQGSPMRSAPDVSYDANPQTGFAVFSSMPYNGQAGWFQVGGTSAGAPQWAALVAIADQGRALRGLGSLNAIQWQVYQMPASAVHDIVQGNNGYPTLPGYDVATGRGSPYADRVVSYLVSGTVTTGSTPAPPVPSLPPSPPPPPPPPPVPSRPGNWGRFGNLDEVVSEDDSAPASGPGFSRTNRLQDGTFEGMPARDWRPGRMGQPETKDGVPPIPSSSALQALQSRLSEVTELASLSSPDSDALADLVVWAILV